MSFNIFRVYIKFSKYLYIVRGYQNLGQLGAVYKDVWS